MDVTELGRGDCRDQHIPPHSSLHFETLPTRQRPYRGTVGSAAYQFQSNILYFLFEYRQVFNERKNIARIDLYVKSLATSLKAVVLQPSAKSGIHSKFADLVGSNTNILARWMLHCLKAKDLLKPEVQVIVNALKLWEYQWAESRLGVVSRLTVQEFTDMFLGTKTVLENIQTVQGLIKVSKLIIT